MHPKLDKLFTQIEADRTVILAETEALTEEQFAQAFLPGKWSAAQIMAHLITSERLSVIYMKKKSLGVDALNNSGGLESLKFFMLKISQRLPLKFNAPKLVLQHTPTGLQRIALVEQWNASRNDLKNFLASIDEKNLYKKIYKHPVVGMLDVLQAVAFFNEHVHHHRSQLRKLIVAARKTTR